MAGVVSAGVTLAVDEHPLLDLRAFTVRFPRPLGEMPPAPAVAALLSTSASAPLASDDGVKKTVRDLLRHGGFKPTGRSKPSAEYLRKAVESGRLGPINLAVDLGNVVSLHSGLPISVVDFDRLDRGEAPLRVGLAEAGASYVFNRSGQIIDVGKLLCLIDQTGPCANAVKDAQRSKTDESTQTTLSLIWGTSALAERSERTLDWYLELLADFEVAIERLV